MSVNNLLFRVKGLRDVMESCQERFTRLVQDYQVNVLQTAAVIAAAKINEEKAEIEQKRQCLREQIEKEKERSRETVKKVYKSAEESIEALLRDQEKEFQEAMDRVERQQKVKVKTETREETVQTFAGGKRKYSELKESKEFEEEDEEGKISKYADNENEDFKCADCGRLSPNMFMCDQCQVTTYCNELCQARDWYRHQQHCTEATDSD